MQKLNAAKQYGLRLLASVLVFLVPGYAMAQGGGSTSYVPTAASGLFSQMGTDFTTLFGYAFGPLVIIVGSMLAWRYTRKLGSKV